MWALITSSLDHVLTNPYPHGTSSSAHSDWSLGKAGAFSHTIYIMRLQLLGLRPMPISAGWTGVTMFQEANPKLSPPNWFKLWPSWCEVSMLIPYTTGSVYVVYVYLPSCIGHKPKLIICMCLYVYVCVCVSTGIECTCLWTFLKLKYAYYFNKIHTFKL